ncbi:MAG: hypothetical protein GY816_10925 [Cytophagales bacterium]|nr:hypothetical protein [Cytophagales bacterium]
MPSRTLAVAMPRLPSEFCPVITEMYPDIFFHDFERTEHSDSLHAILGRALIVATRFDAMCVAASRHKEFNELSIDANSNEDISKLLNKIANKNQTLHASIKRLNLQEPLSEVLAASGNRTENATAFANAAATCVFYYNSTLTVGCRCMGYYNSTPSVGCLGA